jgi:Putative nucleotidyltransferase DUF294
MISDDESRVLEAVRQCGSLGAYRRLIAENDALIQGPDLKNGRAIATIRTAIHTALAGQWAEEQQRVLGYNKPFAMVALGGTGRGEVTPCSDLDFAFLFDDALEGNALLLELQRQMLHTSEFREQHGFSCVALAFGIDDMPSLAEKQLNSFLDMRPVFDPSGLADRFRERIQATFDPFEHFLHVRRFWKKQWEAAAAASERLDRFDIKNDGLRVFLGGIWTLAGKTFIHSHDVYRTLEEPRDLEAYDFLLRIRAWVHLRRLRSGRPDAFANHPADVLGFEDFVSFGEMLGPESDERMRFDFADAVRSRLLSARRRVAVFARAVIERELRRGRAVAPRSPIIYGTGGLYHTGSAQCCTEREKSRAALSLLLASQRYGVAIDPSELHATFRNAGDWLVRVPEVSALFYEQRGSLADSFEFLSQIDGTEERLFPGYGKFESTLDSRVMCERLSLRGALERQKMRTLERYVGEGAERLVTAVSPKRLTTMGQDTVAINAALLDSDHLAAVKLALKIKRLPFTPQDQATRDDESRPLHERYTSGCSSIPLAEYFAPYVPECEFTPQTVEIAKFLVVNRRTFKEYAEAGRNDAQLVERFARLCRNEQHLRALFAFTCADRAEWESDRSEPVRWWNIRELYAKALETFRPMQDRAGTLEAAGYGEDELTILRDFGEDFFSGLYRLHAIRFGAHLVRLAKGRGEVGPKAAIIRDGTSTMLAVATRDYRGLAASISGALWQNQVELRQAHLFSAMNHGLALDFFHIAPGEKPIRQDLSRIVEEAIRTHRHIATSDEAGLPLFDGRFILTESRPGQHWLRFETSRHAGGLIYALTYKVFRYLEGNIHGLTAHTARGNAYISIYYSLPAGKALDEARAIVESRFKNSGR